jgi:hypothetical protein
MNLKEHLKQRHLDLELHRPILDEELNIVSFYCWNLSGQLVGYQQYNPLGNKKIFNSKLEGKYYTYRNKNQPTVVVWGIESLYQSDGVVYLTEGIFDAARMTNLGQSALASLANNPPKDYINFFLSLNRPIVAVCDNDVAGRKLAKFGDYVEVVPEGKDLGDAPDEYIQYLIKKYSSS